jgi:hypothetical protein
MNKILAYLLSVIFLISGWTVTWAKEVYEFKDIERIIAIGDLHGDFVAYAEVMETAGLRNAEGNWAGGKTHLVQTGDITDRGPNSKKILDDLKKLTKQAKKAGGRVHILLGNHEMMNMLGDLRYVDPGEYQAFRTRKSEVYLDDYFDRYIRSTLEEEAWEEWYDCHPPGFVEHRIEWTKGGKYFSRAIKFPSAIKINDTLFAHAGISPQFVGLSLKDFNKYVQSLIKSGDEEALQILFSEEAPLWYRGLAENEGEDEATHVALLLEKHNAKRIVIAHTPTGGFILPRFDSQVIVIDVGIGEYYGSNRGFLLFENGQWYGVHWGEKIPLPAENQASLLNYLTKVSTASPDPYWAEQKIQELESAAER